MSSSSVAILSDIHANVHAFRSVLADIESELGKEAEFAFLGDAVGYGPSPVETLLLLKKAKWCLLGNHDQAMLFDPPGFRESAFESILWTRSVVERQRRPLADELYEWFGELPQRVSEWGMLFVHASPRNPVNDYVRPEDIYNQKKMDAIGKLMPQVLFCGHTHIAGVFELAEGDVPRFIEAEEIDGPYIIPSAGKTIINPGSVGQPRDGDWRASYVIVDPVARSVRFRRVEYPVDDAIRAFDGTGLNPFFAERLRTGR